MKTTLLKGSVPHLVTENFLDEFSMQYLMLNLPYSCNYKCLKCCNITESYPIIQNTKPALKTKEIQSIIEEAAACGYKVMILAGEGEPLLHKDFAEIIKQTAKNNLIPYVFTNGSLLNDHIINFLAEHQVSLIISMDSLHTDRYRKLTKNGDIAGILKNIENSRKIYSSLIEETEIARVVSLAINTVVTRINVDEIQNIKDFCGNDIVFVCNQPTRIGFAEKNWNLLYNSDLPDISIDDVINQYSKENGPLGSTPDGKWCAYMKNGISIGYDGSILGCAYSLESAGFFGTYKKGSFIEIHKKVMDSIDEFYKDSGHSRCLLRHPQYNKWISSNIEVGILNQ